MEEKIRIRRIRKKEAALAEGWNGADKEINPHRTLLGGGRIYGAFDGGRLVGLACVEKTRFGSDRQYCLLSFLRVLEPYREKGIGERLFHKAAKAAVSFGAKKLYVSFEPTPQALHFYEALGCKEAEEYDEEVIPQKQNGGQMECAIENRYICLIVGAVTGSITGLIYGYWILQRTPLGLLFGLAAGVLIGSMLDRARHKTA